MKKTIRKWMLSIKNELRNPDRSPRMKAMSVAIGVFIAISPFMGFHFIMAFATLALYRKLDKVLVLGFTMVNNWWTMVPIYGVGLWMGGIMTGNSGLDIGAVRWEMLTLTHFIKGDGFTYVLEYLKPMILPFLVGNTVFSILAAVAAYAVVLALLKRRMDKGRTCDGICVPSSEHN